MANGAESSTIMKTRKGYADGPFGQIHYQEAGGGVPLVLCHQSPSSSAMFRPAYPLLAAAGVRAIGMDTPAFGQSDPPPRPHSIAGYARAVPALLDHLNLDQAAILGHHTGAAIAAEAAVTWPARITRVILNGPPVLTLAERKAYRDALDSAPRSDPQADGSHLLEIWNRRATFTPGWTSVEAMHNGVIQMLIAGDAGLDGFHAAFDHDIAETIRRITQPTLILTNTGDDIYSCAQRARELRPDFDYVELSGGTHDIVDEQPQAWADAVTAFVLQERR